jgi:hypothetical protein
MHTIARMLYVGLLAGTGFALLGGADSAVPARDGGESSARVATPLAREVYLAGGLSDEALIALGSAVAGRPGAMLLLDSKPLTPYLRHFLAAYCPDRVIPVGTFPGGKAELERRLGLEVATPIPWSAGPPRELWQAIFPKADCLVVCSAWPRANLLRAACLAALRGAPLWVGGNQPAETFLLQPWLQRWGTREVLLAGALDRVQIPAGPVLRVVPLRSAEAIDSACERCLRASGRIENAVLANPADGGKNMGGMSVLAPWLAVSRHATLLLTNDTGTDVAGVVARARQRKALHHLDTLILAANLKALPMLQRPNPIPGDRDPAIDLEPLTPGLAAAETSDCTEEGPVSYAVGRLFHDDRAVVPLMLARQELMRQAAGPRRALVASNPGGSLPLLEAFSRNTAQELGNAGYEVTARFGKALTGPELRKEMIGKDVLLWEGHHNTLIKDWAFASWDEPLPPTFVFLQSCLALKDYKVGPLLGRGAVGVVGSSTRTYSASGGALSLAFFNALLYEGQTLGGSLRQAKNFLLAYARLKEKRLGAQAARTGANHRAAWAFTLWGDPTFRLPLPGAPVSALPAVRHEVQGNTIHVELPSDLLGKVRTSKYRVQMLPNGRLAGLVRKKGDEEDGQPLVPFVFVEFSLPRARPGQTPRLRTRLPGSHWVLLWDARRRTGYLLASPRPRDSGELRFQVDWPGPTVVEGAASGREEVR